MKPKSTSWGGVAEWYDDLVEGSDDSYQKNVILPHLTRIVAPKEGVAVFDVACGQGYFSRAFAEAGARVVGSDISPELIEIAKQKEKEVGRTQKEEIQYHTASADALSYAANSSADVAVIVLALQNIENFAGAIAECARILKPKGRCVLVLNHPAFRISGRSSWQWDEKESKQYRRIDGYMSDSQATIDMTPGKKNKDKKEFTVSFHRPLQSYVKALNKAGLSITRLEEWISHRTSEKGPRSAEEDRIRKEIPLFMCVEATKQ